MTRILHLDASARIVGSVTRTLGAAVVERLSTPATQVTHRDLSPGLPVIDAAFVDATFTPDAQRTAAQKSALELSDTLVAELEAADIVVIATPMYNFGPPAALKAWIDQVARAGRTFRYSEYGPEGLLTGKRAVIVIASGGTQIGSEIDFATGYLRHVLGFLGIDTVDVVTPGTPDTELPRKAA